MSTAIMSQNTLYDFGDSIIKNGMTNPETTPGAHLGGGSNPMRLSLTRVASTPAGSTNSNLAAAILDKINDHRYNFDGKLTLEGKLTFESKFTLENKFAPTPTPVHRRLERTQSAPAPTPSGQISPTSVNTSRYKTELCRPYEEFGVCKYGDKCQFAHGAAELRTLARHPKYKTELCRTFHTVGFCPYGPRCHFVHNQDEVLQKNPTAAVSALLGRPCPTNGILRPKPTALSPATLTPTTLSPTALSPALSLDSPSPPSSLSQSPTSSLGSFFASEPELHSPLSSDEQRLPVFHRLSGVDGFLLRDFISQH